MKYDLSKIMTKAWELFRKLGNLPFAEACIEPSCALRPQRSTSSVFLRLRQRLVFLRSATPGTNGKRRAMKFSTGAKHCSVLT